MKINHPYLGYSKGGDVDVKAGNLVSLKLKTDEQKDSAWFLAFAKSRSPDKVAEYFGFTPE